MRVLSCETLYLPQSERNSWRTELGSFRLVEKLLGGEVQGMGVQRQRGMGTQGCRDVGKPA